MDDDWEEEMLGKEDIKEILVKSLGTSVPTAGCIMLLLLQQHSTTDVRFFNWLWILWKCFFSVFIKICISKTLAITSKSWGLLDRWKPWFSWNLSRESPRSAALLTRVVAKFSDLAAATLTLLLHCCLVQQQRQPAAESAGVRKATLMVDWRRKCLYISMGLVPRPHSCQGTLLQLPPCGSSK